MKYPTKLAEKLDELGLLSGTVGSVSRGTIAAAAKIDIAELDAAVEGKLTLRREQFESLAHVLKCDLTDISELNAPKRVYIAGPIISAGPDYTKPFRDAEALLQRKGFDSVSPAAVTSKMPNAHLSRREIMTLGVLLLSECDAICMLPGWESSNGATMERSFAIATNKTVYALEEIENMDDVERPDAAVETERERKLFEVPTPVGTLKIYASDDENPGVLIDVQFPDGETKPLSATKLETDAADGKQRIVTHAWANGDDSDAPITVRHNGFRDE